MSRLRTAVKAMQLTDRFALALLLLYVLVFSILTIGKNEKVLMADMYVNFKRTLFQQNCRIVIIIS